MPGTPAEIRMAIRGTSGAASPSALFYLIAAAAILFGLWGRFKGLGAWPLSDDEYYTARAVQDILRVGTPEYDCGGWYTRGLPFQYLAGLIQLLGVGPALSLRIITAVSSLLVLPAAYLLGRRAHGRTAGLLVVTILATSVWEIEMARFGRMYAPFQAIFAWYLVYFVRYVVDQDRRALWPMLALSVLGVFVWEGGLFILALNALQPFIGNTEGRLSGRDVVYVVLTALLVVPVYYLVFNDLRYSSEVPAFPEGFDLDAAMAAAAPKGVPGWAHIKQGLRSHPGWLLVMALPLAALWPALTWIWRFRTRWLAAGGLLLALMLALLHQFTASASILLAMLLARVVRPADLLSRSATGYGAAILLSLLGWSFLGLLSDLWIPPDASNWLGDGRPLVVFNELFGRPDYLRQVVRPWVGAASLYGLVLLLSLGIAVVNDLRSPSPNSRTLSVLLLVVFAMLCAVGISNPPRQETRYVFFLYPAVIVVAVATWLIVVPRLRAGVAIPAIAGPVVILLGFVLLEDFRPRHVLAVDSAAASMRIGFRGRADDHLIARTDPRSAAEWAVAHADQPDDLLVNGYPAASFYSKRFQFAYTDVRHQRYRAFACARGTIERWSNLPLLSSVDGLAYQVRLHDRTFFVADDKQAAMLLAEMPDFSPVVVWRSADAGVSVVRMTPDKRAP